MFTGGYDITLHHNNRNRSHESRKNSVELTSYYLPENTPVTSSLHYAARIGSLPLVQKILENGDNDDDFVNKTRWSGVTPLHRAASLGHLDVVEYLLTQPKCDANLKTIYGWHTPLHFACHNGHYSVCVALILAGGEWVCVNKDGETPRDWCRMGGFESVGRKIEQFASREESGVRGRKMKEMEEAYEVKRKGAMVKTERRRSEGLMKAESEEMEKRKRLEKLKSFNLIDIDEVSPQAETERNKITTQMPVNLPKILYSSTNSQQQKIYQALIASSKILKPRRYGGTTTNCKDGQHFNAYCSGDKYYGMVGIEGIGDGTLSFCGKKWTKPVAGGK